MRQKVFPLLVNASNIFSGLFSDNNCYYKNIKTTPSDCLVYDNFLNFLEENYLLASIGGNWILQYCLYQFSFYIESVETKGIRAVNLLFGNKAIERYKRSTEESRFHSLCKTAFVDKSLIKRYLTQEKKQKGVVSEFIKSNYQNRLKQCFQSDFTFDSKSPTCHICSYNKQCSELSKKYM